MWGSLAARLNYLHVTHHQIYVAKTVPTPVEPEIFFLLNFHEK